MARVQVERDAVLIERLRTDLASEQQRARDLQARLAVALSNEPVIPIPLLLGAVAATTSVVVVAAMRLIKD